MGGAYRHPALKELKDQQARFAPRDRVLEQIDRAEQLLGEIDPAKVYPFEYLFFRITGFRPRGDHRLLLDGAGVLADLRLYVADLSAILGQPVEQAPEPVLTVDEVSRRYNVTTRTITRWRTQGLVARRFVVDGRTKVVFLESSLAKFVDAHRDQVDRGRSSVASTTTSARRSSAGRGGWPRSGRRAWSRSPGGSPRKWTDRPKRSG